MNGFRKIIRATSVILKAAETLESLAACVEECEQVDGEWPEGADEAKAEVADLLAQASALRNLLKGGA